MGESMLIANAKPQVEKLLKSGGWEGLLKAMRDRDAELKGKLK
jgi:hypothetical protein